MSPAHTIELVLGLLVVVLLIVTVSRRIGLPYPILLVLGGLALGMVPGLPHIELEPELVFLLFLPPILFSAGYFTSFRDFKADVRAIGLLAVGLVLATTLVVGLVAHALIPELPLPAAFVLGAIVSPPDAIVTTSLAQRLGLPRRLVTILEGESLVNDATALVAYRVGIAVTLGSAFSLLEVSAQFALVAVGGVLVGLLVGAAVVWLFRRLDDPPVEVTVSLLAPFAAYIPAETAGVSGVLASVTAGILVGFNAPRVMASETRLLGTAVWQVLLFLVNGIVFILLGLQLPSVVAELDRPLPDLLVLAAVVSLTVMVVRMIWVYPGAYLPRMLSRSLRERDPYPPWQRVFVLGWAGMRGMVSLAAALALPTDFPQRGLILFLTFAVILATLVGQGLTLPWVIRVLGAGEERTTDQEELAARDRAIAAAVARIEELELEWPGHQPLIDQLRAQYDHRSKHLAESRDGATTEAEQELLEHAIIRRAVIDAERDAIIQLRDRGAINDEVLRRLERDLDLEQLRLEA